MLRCGPIGPAEGDSGTATMLSCLGQAETEEQQIREAVAQ